MLSAARMIKADYIALELGSNGREHGQPKGFLGYGDWPRFRPNLEYCDAKLSYILTMCTFDKRL